MAQLDGRQTDCGWPATQGVKRLFNKVLIIGWDGATWTYIDPLLADDKLPNLARLLQRGVRATLHSTIPPFTNIAWPSLITGLSPAKTGIFDAVQFQKNSYDVLPANMLVYRGIPLWHWINKYNLSAGVLNVPMTYPASRLNGYLVSGFDSPKNSPRVSYPAGIIDQWGRAGHTYRVLDEEIDLINSQNPHHMRGELADFVNRWVDITKHQGEIIAWLWTNQPVDLLFTVFSGTDSINHRTRDLQQIELVYRAADEALGRILQVIDDQTLICLISDHGSTSAWRYISLNHALHREGWLKFKPLLTSRAFAHLPKPIGPILHNFWARIPKIAQKLISWPLLKLDKRLAVSYENIDWDRTQIFARSNMGPLYINMQGKFPKGIVSPEKSNILIDDVTSFFLNLHDSNGTPIFQRIWRKGDIYPELNPQDSPPDLILEPANWSDHMITGFPTDPLVREIPDKREYGTHNPKGILVLAGPVVRRGEEIGRANLVDIVPTILAAWSLPIPRETDGRVLEDGFSIPLKITRISSENTDRSGQAARVEDSEEILDRFRALGYLE